MDKSAADRGCFKAAMVKLPGRAPAASERQAVVKAGRESIRRGIRVLRPLENLLASHRGEFA